jgi:hypothetical protein
MAFIRRQPPRSVDVGTRPGLHGQTLISCGLADVDKALGGGLPLGCIWVVLEDYHSQQHLSLLRYFLAEGLACQHATCWITPRPSAAAAAAVIPQQSTSGAEQAAAASPSSSQVGHGLHVTPLQSHLVCWIAVLHPYPKKLGNMCKTC